MTLRARWVTLVGCSQEKTAAFRKLLEETASIKSDSVWRKVHERLEDEPAARALDKIDRLEVFQEYIRELERAEAAARQVGVLPPPPLSLCLSHCVSHCVSLTVALTTCARWALLRTVGYACSDSFAAAESSSGLVRHTPHATCGGPSRRSGTWRTRPSSPRRTT